MGGDVAGEGNARSALNESLSQLGLDQVDLYLIHWPKPRQNAYVEAWKELVKLQEEGRAKSIGVSNFTISHLKRIVDAAGVAPSVNQIELHPRFQQKELEAYHTEHGIMTESWSPLGQGTLLETQRSKHWPKSMAERQPKLSFGGISIVATW